MNEIASFIALNRFGFGAAPGDLRAVGSDPAGWVKRQDHAKHGIVAELPAGEDPNRVITWLVVAATVLRTVVEPGHEWAALVHEPEV